MSVHCHLREATMQNLRQMHRQMKMLDMRLQMLRDKLCIARMQRCSPPCCSPPYCSPPCCSPPGCSPPGCSPPCCSPPCCRTPCCRPLCCRHLARKALCARLDLERRMDRLRRLAMMLSSSCCQSPLALVDVKGFDPQDVTVMMKDGRVTVSAERKEERNTCRGKACSYRKYTKEFSLPPCCEKEVTYSVKSDSLTEIVEEPKCCSYICNC